MLKALPCCCRCCLLALLLALLCRWRCCCTCAAHRLRCPLTACPPASALSALPQCFLAPRRRPATRHALYYHPINCCAGQPDSSHLTRVACDQSAPGPAESAAIYVNCYVSLQVLSRGLFPCSGLPKPARPCLPCLALSSYGGVLVSAFYAPAPPGHNRHTRTASAHPRPAVASIDPRPGFLSIGHRATLQRWNQLSNTTHDPTTLGRKGKSLAPSRSPSGDCQQGLPCLSHGTGRSRLQAGSVKVRLSA